MTSLLLPVSQWVPMNPAAHVQLYPFTSSLHVAELIQGEEAHSSMSEIREIRK